MGVERRLPTINTDKITADEDGQPLSPVSRVFHQRSLNCYIIAMMGLGKTIDVDTIKAGLEATIVRHPRFSSVPVSSDDEPGSNKSKWVRTKVVIDNHIVIPNLEPPQTASSATAELIIEDYVSSLSSTTLSLSQPLWDLHIINVRTAEAVAVAVMRIHHSIGDGISLTSLLLDCTRKTSDPDSVPSLPRSQSHKVADSTISSSRVLRILLWIWAVLVLTWNTLVGVVNFTATSIFLNDSETPIKGVDGVEFHQKRFVHRRISLDDVKVIKHAVGCTINDVLVGLISSALSRYLNRKYGGISNDRSKAKNNLPENVRLRSTMLVNIRSAPGIHALADMMKGGNGTRWGNSIGNVILPFHIALYKDPLDYVRKGMKDAEMKKNSFEALFAYTCCCLIPKFLGIKVTAALCSRMFRHTTISFSNCVGPIEEVGLYGHPIVYIAPTVYGHPHAITLHFQSYMNKMEMVLAVDELAVPDPHQFLDDLEESLKLIKNSIAN